MTVSVNEELAGAAAEDDVFVFPLSFAQERLWLVDQLQPGNTAYNVPLSVRLEGALDVDALRRALDEVVRRHESLRTVFPVIDGAPAQVVHPPRGVPLPVDDLAALPGDERPAELRRRLRGVAAEPFDLAAGPLLRARLLRVSEGEHVLAACMHHIVTDGWSMGIFMRELSALYAAFRDGLPSPLPEPELQYADFALWQRQHLGDGGLSDQLGYWTAKLAGAPALLELPTDHPRPPVQSFRGAGEPLTLPRDLADALRTLAQREGATLFMVLLAAWQLLLSRHSGQADVVVGTTLAGRTRREVEPLIGMFFNTLPLRANLSGDPEFTALLAQVRETTLEAYAHQDLPFEKLVEALAPERTLSRTPVVQVLFELQNNARAELALPGLKSRGVGGAVAQAKFDLTLSLTEGEHGLSGVLQYAAELFEPETIQRMLGHFSVLLAEIARDARRPLSALPMLPASERHEVVSAWNDTDHLYAPATLHALFEAQARRTPDAPALVQGGRRLSYAELDATADRIAALLRRHGAGPEVRVALLLERTPELIASLLGVLKAGAAYLPLDPTHPPERLAYMVGDAGARLILTHAPLREMAASLGAAAGSAVAGVLDVVDAPESAAVVGGATARAVEGAAEAGPENLAYVYYTSGSTGRPKGVAMHHRGICNYVQWGVPAYGADQEGGAPVFTSIAVDLTLANLLPLFAGRPVELLPEGPALEALADRLKAGPAFSFIKITPTHLALLNALLTPEEAARTASALVIGADNLLAEPTRFWQDTAPEVRLLNEYGPTETVVGCALYELANGRHRTGRVPIGRAIDNLRMYVLDADMAPVPVGVAGELYIGGIGVARGYLGRARLTAEKFVPDPYAGDPGARLYRTGDRARWRAGGQMEFLGRLDHQAKVRGYRVEPGEVEAVLREHPGVRAAAVVVRPDANGDAMLAAYVVPAGAVEVAELRAHLKRRVPEYMVPGALMLMDALPLGTTGKLNPALLPAPDAARPEPESDAEPRTDTERALAGFWAEVLHAEHIGRDDNFFELGGHSLLATRVISRIRETLGAELPLRALFEHPTIAGLAADVEDALGAAGDALPPVRAVARPDRVPLSFAQERLWFLSQLDPTGSLFNVPLSLRLEGALDVDALRRALAEVVRRHESLRTVFPALDGTPAQVVRPAGPVPLPVDDLGPAAPHAPEAEVRRRVRDEAARPFDLVEGPLFRARLLRLREDEHVLIACVHHLVTDGWSTAVLLRELSALYAAFRDGLPSPLPEPELQYADFALWQRHHLGDGGLADQLGYWTAKLAGAPALLELPTDHPRPPVQSFRGAGEPLTLPRELADSLRALAQREGATLFMVLLAAWQLLLSRHSGQADVVVGTTLAGRTRREVEPLIGMFFNTLPLRADLSGDPEFTALLARVRETTLEAYAHQDLPFEKLVEALAPERTLSRTPVVQVLFELQNNARAELALPGVKSRGVGGAVAQAKFDLTLSLTEGEHGLSGVLQYAAELFEPETIQRMLGHFSVLLAGIARDAHRPLSALPMLPESERHEVVSAWNDTDHPYAPATLHALFEAQARRTPDAPALVQGGRRLSYAELDATADRIAALLRRHGAGPEVRVALLLERTPELIASLLGVLKAGAAYLPLDPTHPPERLAYMVGDAGARLILTHAPLREMAASLGAASGSAAAGVLDVEDATEAEPAGGVAEAGPENLAYVYYTSGSTGRPKGVAMHHRGICNYVQWGVPAYGADREGGAPVFTSIAVDLTLANLLPLFAGRPVDLLPEGPALEALADRLKAGPAFSFIKITPTHLALLNALLTPEEAARTAGALVIGADNLLAEPTRFWQDAAPDVRLLNEYGPTETVVGCALYELANGKHRTGRVPIGRAIDNLRMYVLDDVMAPVPVGVAGELYIGGIGVARGYLGRAGLTAEKFVPDFYAGDPGARLYRTGDRARWRAGGQMEFLGRLDHQAKVRGYRVEPGEVEAVLREHPGVRAAAVVVRPDANGDAMLAAYVVPAGAVEVAELRAHLKRRVPEYMVPGALMLMDALPLGTTGKLDPTQLPAPQGATEDRADRYTAPADELEERLAGIWAEVLGVERVGAEDDFFELGGHSLLAARLVAAIRRRLGSEVPLATLLQGGTVRTLAAGIRGQAGAPPSVLVELRGGGEGEPLFLVHGAGGGLLAYTALLRRLPAGRAVYGLQDPLQAQDRYSDLRVEEFARIYLDAVRAVQPAGPYHLAGLSFGGTIAFEMARRLRAEGEEVAFLGLLDTWAPSFSDHHTSAEEAGRKALIGLARERAREVGREFPLHAADLEGMEPRARVELVMERLREMGALPAGARPEATLQALDAMWARTEVQRLYRPAPYPGRITLFTSAEVDPEFRESWPAMVDAALADPARGWQALAERPVEVHTVAGTHTSMMKEPSVASLAGRLARCLAGGEDGRESSSGAPARARAGGENHTGRNAWKPSC